MKTVYRLPWKIPGNVLIFNPSFPGITEKQNVGNICFAID